MHEDINFAIIRAEINNNDLSPYRKQLIHRAITAKRRAQCDSTSPQPSEQLISSMLHRETIICDSNIKLVPMSSKQIDKNTLVQSYLDWFNDNEVRIHLYPTTPREREPIQKWIKEISNIQNTTIFYYAIMTDSKIIGHVGLKNASFKDRYAEIAIVIGDKSYWNKQIGQTAFYSLMAHVVDFFTTLDIVESTNPAILHTADKIGFTGSKYYA